MSRPQRGTRQYVQGAIQPSYYAGFDLSLTASGIVILNQDGVIMARKVIKPKCLGAERLNVIQNEIRSLISAFKPTLVCIEGYASGKNMETYARQAELGGVVRLLLYRLGIPYDDRPKPTQVKKYATGHGGGDGGSKDQVTMHCYKNWGFEAVDNNEADAFVLARIALTIQGFGGTLLTKEQLEVIHAIQNPTKKTKKKKDD